MIQKLIFAAFKSNAISLSLEFLGTHDVTDILSSLRFSKRISNRRVTLYPVNNSYDDKNALYNVDNWYLTSADELG